MSAPPEVIFKLYCLTSPFPSALRSQNRRLVGKPPFFALKVSSLFVQVSLCEGHWPQNADSSFYAACHSSCVNSLDGDYIFCEV